MIKLKEIEELMKPNFVFDKVGKRMQTLEYIDGTKELARTIFVGIADMYGIDGSHVMDYIDIGYDTFRNRLRYFRETYKKAKQYDEEGLLQALHNTEIKFYNKTRLCVNAISLATKRDAYITINQYTHDESD